MIRSFFLKHTNNGGAPTYVYRNFGVVSTSRGRRKQNKNTLPVAMYHKCECICASKIIIVDFQFPGLQWQIGKVSPGQLLVLAYYCKQVNHKLYNGKKRSL